MKQVLVARQDATVYHYEVWTDTTQFAADGITPNPAYVRPYEFTVITPPGLTAAQYQANCLAEIQGLAAQASADPLDTNYDQGGTGTTLGQQGTTF